MNQQHRRGPGEAPGRAAANARRLLHRVRERLPSSWNHPSLLSSDLPDKPEGDLRLVTLNLAHGRVKGHQVIQSQPRMRQHLDVVARTLRGAKANVVALQEADGPSSWSGKIDHVAHLAELSELPHHYRGDHNQVGVGPLNFKWGTALLSDSPFLWTDSCRFGQSWRDTKGYVVAEIEVPGWPRPVNVASVHLDFLKPSVRRRQIRQMADGLASEDRPLILLGDLNCNWFQEPRSLALLMDRLGLRAYQPTAHRPTYPSSRPWMRLDWVLISEELEFGDLHGSLADRVSDHLPVVADISFR